MWKQYVRYVKITLYNVSDLLRQQVNSTGAIRNNGSSIYSILEDRCVFIFIVRGVHVWCQLRQTSQQPLSDFALKEGHVEVPASLHAVFRAPFQLQKTDRHALHVRIQSYTYNQYIYIYIMKKHKCIYIYTKVYIYIQRICKWHLCTYQCACELQRLHTHSVRPTHCIKKWHS